jgi:hypothetical protein
MWSSRWPPPLDLLPSEENLVRMCAVVDVGAGTTDIGLFLSLVPDGASKVRSKLYRTGHPVSVFKAGQRRGRDRPEAPRSARQEAVR